MNPNFKTAAILFACFFSFFIPHTVKSQCSIPPATNAILRQPDLYQLIGNNNGAYDTPTGQQDITNGNTLNDGNWLNRGTTNLIKNGDFNVPGATTYIAIANGTGGQGSSPIGLQSIPEWLVTGNSVNAYPYYCLYFINPPNYSTTDFGATRYNLYLGNSQYSFYTQQPLFDHGYATNSDLVNPYINSDGIQAGYGQASGDPIAVKQSIVTLPGTKYRIQFFISGENLLWTNWLMGLDITGYRRAILLVPGGIGSVRYEFEFKAVADTTTINFVNWGHSFNGGTEFVLDDIIVNQVPPSCTVVPIKFLSFEIDKPINAVNLHWQVAFEQENHHFEIENSNDGITWLKIASIPGAGTSNSIKEYYFIHNNPKSGYNYYRLKQVDTDGRYSYSEIRKIYIGEKENTNIIYNSISNRIEIHANSIGIASATLLSCDGKKIMELHDNTSISSLPAGLYLITVIDKKANTFLKKIIKN